MTAETLAIFPAVAAAVSILNGVYAFQRRRFRGALYFFLMPLGTAVWSLGYCAELLAPTQAARIVFDNIEFIGSDLVVIGFFVFAWHYTKGTRPPLWLLGFPILNQLLAWTDQGWLRADTATRAMGGIEFLTYNYGPWMWFNIAVYYGLLLAGSWLFARKLRHSRGIFRRQIWLLLLTGVLPWAVSTLTVFGLLPLPIPNLDISPPSLALGNLLLTAALFWSGALRIGPVAREIVFELMEDGIVIADTSGAIVDFNSTARRLLQQFAEVSVGSPVPGILQQNGQIELRPGQFLQVQKSELASSRGSQGTIYTIRDVTADRQAFQALRDATDNALQASQAKSVFLANMSHEMRTPLTAILGIAEILQETSLDADQRRMVQSFQKAGENLLGTINDILDLSRIEAGKMPLAPRSFHPGGLISSVCQLFRIRLGHSTVELRQTLDESLPENVFADDFRLNQILSNLIGNAVKFTSSGFVEVAASWSHDVLSVRVTDTGPGISPDRLDAVFRAFEQADASATRAYGGSGLGLAIVRELVRLLGGTIEAESTPGKGSTFVIRVPAPSAETAEPAAPPQGAPEQLPYGPLLVAEDTESIRDILSRHLERLGIPAVFVANGQEALDRFRGEKFEAVVLDIQMPVMDGFQAARTMRAIESAEHRPRTPLIALSASAMPEDVQRAKQAGFDLHIAKPVSREQLKDALQSAMRSI